MARDETFRGKIRRVFSKVYSKIKHYTDKLLDLFVIHWSKFSLIALFIVSASKANFFNAVLFILFLMLSMISYRHLLRFWKVPIIINALILIYMYGVDVFKPKGILSLDTPTLNLIGITLNEDGSVNVSKYTPYLILQVVLIITYYIINS